MPNRILRPWLDSEAVNTLTDAEEVFFIRLIMAADDFGRFYGTPQLLKSYLYPLKDKRTADMPRLVAACEKAGMIASYEVSGRRYIQILKFKQQVRTAESKFPEPPPEILARCETSKKRGARAKQMQSECVADDMQMNITCEADETQTQSNCTRNTETETKTDIKMVSELHSSTITPEPGKPGSPGRRNAEKTHLFFDYEGDSRIHGVTPELLAYWREMYPALDIEAELKKASDAAVAKLMDSLNEKAARLIEDGSGLGPWRLMGVCLLSAVVVLASNLLTDILYAVVDPTIKY